MRTAVIVAICLTLFATSAQTQVKEQADKFACLDEIPHLLEQVDLSVLRLFFCEEFSEGVQFSLRNFFLNGDRRYDQGGGPELLQFRHSGYLARDKNRLETILVPRTKELWDVHWRDQRDPDVVSTSDGNTFAVVWGTNMRLEEIGKPTLPIDDNSMRMFTCGTVNGGGCFTHYNTVMCERYLYPKLLDRGVSRKNFVAQPIIRVKIDGLDRAEEVWADYERHNVLVRKAIKIIMEESCK